MIIDQPFPDLTSWVRHFSGVNIPVLRHTAHELEQLREKADTVNARALAGVILRDPLMTLRVLAYIEANRKKRQTTDITTIERALMMIGIDPFFRDFQNLPLVEEQLKGHPRALIGVLKVIGRARKAAHWARDWAIIRHDIDVDEITVASLLYDMAEVLMWCFAPTLALNVFKIQTENRQLRSLDVQRQAYGIALYELKSGLVNAWRLPELLHQLLDNEVTDNPRILNVKLAIDLARHSANGWDDAALPDDIRAIVDLLHLPMDQLLHKIGLESDAPLVKRMLQTDANGLPGVAGNA